MLTRIFCLSLNTLNAYYLTRKFPVDIFGSDVNQCSAVCYFLHKPEIC